MQDNYNYSDSGWSEWGEWSCGGPGISRKRACIGGAYPGTTHPCEGSNLEVNETGTRPESDCE